MYKTFHMNDTRYVENYLLRTEEYEILLETGREGKNIYQFQMRMGCTRVLKNINVIERKVAGLESFDKMTADSLSN